MSSIDKLNKNYDILIDAKDKISEHEKEYREIIEVAKVSEMEKRLALICIGKFFKFFPALTDAAVDAQLDLCKDENIQIRRHAIRNLPLLCEDTKTHISRICTFLKQLVVSDPMERAEVNVATLKILRFDESASMVIDSNKRLVSTSVQSDAKRKRDNGVDLVDTPTPATPDANHSQNQLENRVLELENRELELENRVLELQNRVLELEQIVRDRDTQIANLWDLNNDLSGQVNDLWDRIRRCTCGSF